MYSSGNCFLNVFIHIKTHGGRAVFGWKKGLSYGGKIQTWVHHCMWENDGLLVDLTPLEEPLNECVFERDDSARLTELDNGLLLRSLPPRYEALTEGVELAIEYLQRADSALYGQRDLHKERYYCDRVSKILKVPVHVGLLQCAPFSFEEYFRPDNPLV